jgi:hypothetical protein
MKKTLLGTALAGLMLTTPGCLGPNRAFNGVHDWNMEVSDSDAVNELVFLGCTILPVYGIAYLVDIVVLNTIEYWSGEPAMGN